MTRHRWTTVAAHAALAGGLAWLAKLTVIAATNGRVDDTGPAAVFFVLGIVLMLLGSTWLGSRLAASAHPVVYAFALAVSPVAFVLSFVLMDSALPALVGSAGPPWVENEAGIAGTALLWLAIGLVGVRANADSGLVGRREVTA